MAYAPELLFSIYLNNKDYKKIWIFHKQGQPNGY